MGLEVQFSSRGINGYFTDSQKRQEKRLAPPKPINRQLLPASLEILSYLSQAVIDLAEELSPHPLLKIMDSNADSVVQPWRMSLFPQTG